MTTHIVSPGEYMVTAARPVVLETCLGSCIGVVLHDPVARVGGMIHVLLPHGREDKEKDAPGRYARSALPLLLSEVLGLGASRQRLVAAVAGGALILADRPLSMEMNIGRRNSEAVLQLLREADIPVMKQEIGGFRGRTLRLDMATGDIHVSFIGELTQRDAVAIPERELTHSDLMSRIDKLKPLPDIARKIILRIEYSDSNMADIERDILKDQALTANVLKLCNSPSHGFQHQIPTIRRALVLIGLNTLKRIILSATVDTVYNRSIFGYSTRKGDLMKHSLSCALVAEFIAREKNIPEPDVAFTAGLLHDIGKVILDQYAFKKFNLIMDRVVNENMSFLDAEDRILGYNHAYVGGMVAEEWKLPPVLVEAIALHHRPQGYRVNAPMVSAVHLADSICSMFAEGGGTAGLSNGIHQFAVSTLGLTRTDMERIVERLPDVMKELEMV
ncbi:MAG: HDOD domain-containing protein [Acidobacteriota bacterium]